MYDEGWSLVVKREREKWRLSLSVVGLRPRGRRGERGDQKEAEGNIPRNRERERESSMPKLSSEAGRVDIHTHTCEGIVPENMRWM